MFKPIGIGTGSRIVQTPEEEQPSQQSSPTQVLPVDTPSLKQFKSGTSLAAEYQMSNFALKSQLQNQLVQNDSLQIKKLATPRLVDKNEASTGAYAPRWLYTGDGDDQVDIKMGSDGRVHVNVNGKEEWSGTPSQFQSLTIYTGAGNDTVKNEVDGATIFTASGQDVVWNKGSNVHIDTGTENDRVGSAGSNNVISTGRGEDIVQSVGNNNSISSGAHKDSVAVKGESNLVMSGSGDDTVDLYGGYNKVYTEDGNDQVDIRYGDTMPESPTPNYVDTGAGNDKVENRTDGSTIFTGSGNDTIMNSGRDVTIDLGTDEEE
jgi:hypothetical protein